MSRQINLLDNVELNRSQERALQTIIATLAGKEDSQSAGHEVAFTVTVEPTTYGNVWVKVEQDIPTLGENNVLRAFTRMDSWFISVGPRGAMNARCFPNYAKGLKKVGRINIAP